MPLGIVEEASLSDVGRQRNTNEDSFYDGPPIFAVADGMGGAQAGEVASQMAVEVFDDMAEDDMPPEAKLEAIAKEANRRIYELAQSDEARAGMGCTFTAALVGDGEVTIGHVGDSRAYRLRGDDFEQLTSDHSLVEELVRQGKLTAAEAEVHPQRSIITRALGPEPEVDVDKFTHPAKAEDVYLLCSDGLSGMVPDEGMAEILRGRSSLEDAARQLIEAANENGGRDNITVILFRIGKRGKAESEGEDETMSGKETRIALDSDEFRTRTSVEETRPRKVRRDSITKEREHRGSAAQRDLTRVGAPTMVLDADTSHAARASSAERARPPSGAAARRPAAARRHPRRRLGAVLVALVVAAAVVGLYVGSRQFYFVGTNDLGLVTLYRGLPYELPLGLELYEEKYVSTVPAASIRDARRRERILDHQLREHGDAVDLVRQLERSRVGR